MSIEKVETKFNKLNQILKKFQNEDLIMKKENIKTIINIEIKNV